MESLLCVLLYFGTQNVTKKIKVGGKLGCGKKYADGIFVPGITLEEKNS
jgi:hypothetical protein